MCACVIHVCLTLEDKVHSRYNFCLWLCVFFFRNFRLDFSFGVNHRHCKPPKWNSLPNLVKLFFFVIFSIELVIASHISRQRLFVFFYLIFLIFWFFDFFIFWNFCISYWECFSCCWRCWCCGCGYELTPHLQSTIELFVGPFVYLSICPSGCVSDSWHETSVHTLKQTLHIITLFVLTK